MEYRQISVGYDAEDGTYFVCGSEFRHLTIEAKSLGALNKQLEALELRPVLSPIYGASAPEFARASRPRTERSIPKFKRLLDEISKRQRRSR